MSNFTNSPKYRKVAEANRQYYAKTAQLYEHTETCVTDPRAQRELEYDIDQIVALIGKPPQMMEALDACGGSGNVAIKLLQRGFQVTISDISSDLLDIFCNKYDKQRYSPTIVCAEIADFLQKEDNKYDLIVFSSALHHLENIEEVLALAYLRLLPGGLLYTIFDPVTRGTLLARGILWFDYLFFKIFKQPIDFFAALARRVHRIISRASGDFQRKTELNLQEENLGVLAEYHVEMGIDDGHLVEALRNMGFEILWHHRYSHARFSFTRFVLGRFRYVTAFKLLVRKRAGMDK